MLLPEEAFPAPPFTDDELEAYFEWAERPLVNDAYPAAGQVVEPEPTPAKWRVEDTGSAEWAMRKLGFATAAVEEIKAQAAEFEEQIKRWKADQLKPYERRVNFFTGQLEDYARRQREEHDQKTVRLPSGEIISRKVPARPEIIEAEKDRFINWARALELPIVKATWKPVMAEVKRLVEFKEVDGAMVGIIDGRPVPGVVLVAEDVSFTVKPNRP